MQYREVFRYTKLIDMCYTAMVLEKDVSMRDYFFNTICKLLEKVESDIKLAYKEVSCD